MQTTGLVTCQTGKHIQVQSGDHEITCIVRGNLQKKLRRTKEQIVIGDEVVFTLLPDGTGLIEKVAPRHSALVRPGYRGVPQPIAANIDQLVIVQSIRKPNFKRQVIERFLVLATRGGMASLIVVTKCDLVSPDQLLPPVLGLKDSGVPIVHTSIANGQGIQDLRDSLAGRVSALCGQSGVGKSSLLNAMYPDLRLRVSAVSRDNDKGRHTTTTSRLFALPNGGYVADTPGIRSLALFDDQSDDVTEVFPEIQKLASQCQFRNCAHTHEPNCAVREAVRSGEIDAKRLRSYLHLKRQTEGRRN